MPLNEIFRDYGYAVQSAADTEYYKEQGKDASGEAQWMHFAEPHGRQRYRDHVEGVQERPSLDDLVPHGHPNRAQRYEADGVEDAALESGLVLLVLDRALGLRGLGVARNDSGDRVLFSHDSFSRATAQAP